MASEMYRYDGLSSSSSSSSDHDERQKQRIPAAYALEPLRKDVSGRLVSSRLSSSSSRLAVATAVCQSTTNQTGRPRLTGAPVHAARGCQPSTSASVAVKWAIFVTEWEN